MLASHLRLCLPNALFPLVFRAKLLYSFPLFRMYGIRPVCSYPFKVVTSGLTIEIPTFCRQCICVFFYGSQKKHKLFKYTTLIEWFL